MSDYQIGDRVVTGGEPLLKEWRYRGGVVVDADTSDGANGVQVALFAFDVVPAELVWMTIDDLSGAR